jgi:hypothetical protein
VIGLLALAALAAAPLPPTTPAPPPPPTSPTLNEARRLPPRALAVRLLGAVGALYPETSIYDGGRTGPRAMVIDLAMAPHPTDYPGLCAASVMDIWFTLISREPMARATEADAPTEVVGLRTLTRYRFTGDSEAARQWFGSDSRNGASLCAAAGPVLQAGEDGRWGYFGDTPDAAQAHLSGRALQQALADARAGTLAGLTCSREHRGASAIDACADPRAFLMSLSPADVISVHVDQCFDDETRTCASLMFEPARDQTIVAVIRIASISNDPEHPGVRIAGVAIQYPTMID